ncbi:MAG TPA: tRNA (adenosine(37)-N6)-threonylcarbamoyltransferase complex transferase subunit TsaD [Acidobacteriota bacterium]|nr:tRNA (adenosine(37)-N6)-threonylcarbamoyltransferase complex transferase subunit TsaD [Acidobacteriota bacterium]
MTADLILGIETSCDETAAAVVRGGSDVLSNVVHSQIDVHREWGGVVPELASRHHAEQIDLIIELALRRAGIEIGDIDAVGATYGPGLIGALLVGVSAAKAIALARGVPFVGIDHIEAHIHSVTLTHGEIPYPALSLVVSGGHTSLFRQEKRFEYELIARTRDDAAGEAYDKVAKLLNIGYPGGPVMDHMAKLGDPNAVPFSPVKMSDGSLDFSFSGLKTAVLHLTRKRPELLERKLPLEEDRPLLDLVASFQAAVISEIVRRIESSIDEGGVHAVGISGGVSNNSGLRAAMEALAERRGVPVFFPDLVYTSDNAGMIAALAWHRLRLDAPSPLDLNPVPNLRLAEAPGARRHPRSG